MVPPLLYIWKAAGICMPDDPDVIISRAHASRIKFFRPLSIPAILPAPSQADCGQVRVSAFVHIYMYEGVRKAIFFLHLRETSRVHTLVSLCCHILTTTIKLNAKLTHNRYVIIFVTLFRALHLCRLIAINCITLHRCV